MDWRVLCLPRAKVHHQGEGICRVWLDPQSHCIGSPRWYDPCLSQIKWRPKFRKERKTNAHHGRLCHLHYSPCRSHLDCTAWTPLAHKEERTRRRWRRKDRARCNRTPQVLIRWLWWHHELQKDVPWQRRLECAKQCAERRKSALDRIRRSCDRSRAEPRPRKRWWQKSIGVSNGSATKIVHWDW